MRLLPGAPLIHGGIQNHGGDSAIAHLFRPNKRVVRIRRKTSFSANTIRVVHEQPIIIPNGPPRIILIAREFIFIRAHNLGERGILPRIMVKNRHVAGRRGHAGGVQTRIAGGISIGSAQVMGERIHPSQSLLVAAQLLRQRVRCIIAGLQQQPVKQIPNGVLPARANAYSRPFLVGGLGTHRHHLIKVKIINDLHG